MLIPAGEDIEHFEVKSEVRWVLVIEKEVILSFIELDCYGRFFSRKSGSLSDFMPITVHQVPGVTWVWVNRHGETPYLSLWDSAHFE